MSNEAYYNLYLAGTVAVGLISILGFVYTAFLFLRFDRIRNWFNRRAGEEILQDFTFRPLRTLFFTACIAFVMFQVVLILTLIPGVSEVLEKDTFSTALVCAAAVALYPLWRIVRRVRCVFSAPLKPLQDRHLHLVEVRARR